MLMQDYISLLNEYEKEKLEDKNQKKRGHNDYNIISILRNIREEVGVHSKIIYSLLNPNGEHYQDSLFLDIFVRDVLEIDNTDFGEITGVYRESPTQNIENSQRRIDFVIESTKYIIGIEMKIDAKDLENQLKDYEKELKQRANNKTIYIYYLTLDGRQANIKSSKDIEYKQISFKEHICKWLEESIQKVQYISNLNVLISQYLDVVKALTNNCDKNFINKLIEKKDYSEFAQQIFEYINEDILEKKFWEELKTNFTNNGYTVSHTNKDKNKEIYNGLSIENSKLCIYRDENLYYKHKEKLFNGNDWKYYEPKINFETKNIEFWKLTNTQYRKYVINNIINFVKSEVKIEPSKEIIENNILDKANESSHTIIKFIESHNTAELLYDLYNSNTAEELFWKDLSKKLSKDYNVCDKQYHTSNQYRGLEITHKENQKSMYIIRDYNLYYKFEVVLSDNKDWKYSKVKIDFVNKKIQSDNKYKYYDLLNNNKRGEIIQEIIEEISEIFTKII